MPLKPRPNTAETVRGSGIGFGGWLAGARTNGDVTSAPSPPGAGQRVRRAAQFGFRFDAQLSPGQNRQPSPLVTPRLHGLESQVIAGQERLTDWLRIPAPPCLPPRPLEPARRRVWQLCCHGRVRRNAASKLNNGRCTSQISAMSSRRASGDSCAIAALRRRRSSLSKAARSTSSGRRKSVPSRGVPVARAPRPMPRYWAIACSSRLRRRDTSAIASASCALSAWSIVQS